MKPSRWLSFLLEALLSPRLGLIDLYVYSRLKDEISEQPPIDYQAFPLKSSTSFVNPSTLHASPVLKPRRSQTEEQ
jgi:hypothetical protein